MLYLEMKNEVIAALKANATLKLKALYEEDRRWFEDILMDIEKETGVMYAPFTGKEISDGDN